MIAIVARRFGAHRRDANTFHVANRTYALRILTRASRDGRESARQRQERERERKTVYQWLAARAAEASARVKIIAREKGAGNL